MEVLNRDILGIIINNLDIEDVLNLSSVNKQIRYMTSNYINVQSISSNDYILHKWLHNGIITYKIVGRGLIPMCKWFHRKRFIKRCVIYVMKSKNNKLYGDQYAWIYESDKLIKYYQYNGSRTYYIEDKLLVNCFHGQLYIYQSNLLANDLIKLIKTNVNYTCSGYENGKYNVMTMYDIISSLFRVHCGF